MPAVVFWESKKVVLFASFIGSGVFWGAVGALAAVASTAVAVVHVIRGRAGEKPTSSGEIEKLEDSATFVRSQLAAIQDAKVAVSLLLHTVHASDASWKAKQINAALVDAKERGLTVRVLTGSGPEQVSGAHELALAGIEVRMNTELLHSDWRFLKVDNSHVLLGIADVEAKNEEYKPSRSWAEMNTAGLGEASEREFQRLWISGATENLYQYCNSYVVKVKDRVPPDRLATDFRLPNTKLIESFYKRPKLVSVMDGATFVCFGKAASGKSTLMRQVAAATAARRLDLEDFVLPYVFRYGNENVVGDKILDIYAEVVVAARSTEYDLIELGSEHSAAVMPQLFEAIRGHGRMPVVIHCKSSLNVALRRNEERVRPVPVDVIQKQDEQEQGGAFRDVCKLNRVHVVEIDTEQEVPTLAKFQQLIEGRPRQLGAGGGIA